MPFQRGMCDWMQGFFWNFWEGGGVGPMERKLSRGRTGTRKRGEGHVSSAGQLVL